KQGPDRQRANQRRISAQTNGYVAQAPQKLSVARIVSEDAAGSPRTLRFLSSSGSRRSRLVGSLLLHRVAGDRTSPPQGTSRGTQAWRVATTTGMKRGGVKSRR